MGDSGRRLTEEQASRLWKRAAKLQAEAAQRLEERSRALVLRDEAPATQPGFEVAEVKHAALEAGISPEFVELALAEMGDDSPRITESSRLERRAARFLGSATDSVEVSAVVPASAEVVYEALQRVLPSARFGLLLTDTLGEDPLEDGVFVFDVPGMTTAGSAAEFASKMGGIGAKKLFVTLRRVGVDPPTTELALRAPLLKGRKVTYLLGLGSTGTAGGLGAVITGTNALGGLGVGAGAGAILTGVALPALAVGAGLGGLTWLGFRALYRGGISSVRDALTKLLKVVSVNARTQGGFALPGVDRPADDPTML